MGSGWLSSGGACMTCTASLYREVSPTSPAGRPSRPSPVEGGCLGGGGRAAQPRMSCVNTPLALMICPYDKLPDNETPLVLYYIEGVLILGFSGFVNYLGRGLLWIDTALFMRVIVWTLLESLYRIHVLSALDSECPPFPWL